MLHEGGIFYKEGQSILLVQCGDVSSPLIEKLQFDLESFIHDILPQDFTWPMVTRIACLDPVILKEQSYEWNNAFHELIKKLPSGIATILVTSQGLWETHPFPRFIFASYFSINTVVLSIRRFYSPNKKTMYNRLRKEVLKALGLALGIEVCCDTQCYMTYHWHAEDLDTNIHVCEECQKFIREQLVGSLGRAPDN